MATALEVSVDLANSLAEVRERMTKGNDRIDELEARLSALDDAQARLLVPEDPGHECSDFEIMRETRMEGLQSAVGAYEIKMEDDNEVEDEEEDEEKYASDNARLFAERMELQLRTKSPDDQVRLLMGLLEEHRGQIARLSKGSGCSLEEVRWILQRFLDDAQNEVLARDIAEDNDWSSYCDSDETAGQDAPSEESDDVHFSDE